jgi:hypothetical protein
MEHEARLQQILLEFFRSPYYYYWRTVGTQGAVPIIRFVVQGAGSQQLEAVERRSFGFRSCHMYSHRLRGVWAA